MSHKVIELRRLLDAGYTVEDVESDDACVEATLRREGRVAKVRVYRRDAEVLLFGDGRRGVRR
jgi:hypothetical protein